MGPYKTEVPELFDRIFHRAPFFYRMTVSPIRPDKIMIIFFNEENIVCREIFRTGINVLNLYELFLIKKAANIPARSFKFPADLFVSAFSDKRKGMTVKAVEDEFVPVGYENDEDLAALFFYLTREIETVHFAHVDLKEDDVGRLVAFSDLFKTLFGRVKRRYFSFWGEIGKYLFQQLSEIYDKRLFVITYEYFYHFFFMHTTQGTIFRPLFLRVTITALNNLTNRTRAVSIINQRA